MDFPWRCKACHHENMVDLDKLSKWPIDKLVTAEGFHCEKCDSREAIFYSTSSLEEVMRKLDALSVDRRDHHYHFLKVLKKATNIHQRTESRWREPIPPPGYH
jgi:hypothetical protein